MGRWLGARIEVGRKRVEEGKKGKQNTEGKEEVEGVRRRITMKWREKSSKI